MNHWVAVVVGLILIVASVLYARGWRRLRVILPRLATPGRAAAFVMATGLTAVALIAPLPQWSHYFLLARSSTNILLTMLAAPLFWLACSFHLIAWGLPHALRRRLTRFCIRPRRPDTIRTLFTNPMFVWFLFLATILLWHDSQVVDRVMPNLLARTLAPLWLFTAGLLYWWQIVGTGPRRYTTHSPLVRLGTLLATEVPNVAAGMFIAFHATPIYDHYATMRSDFPNAYRTSISFLTDQNYAGALHWVVGSMILFGSFILVLNSIWRSVANSERPQPPPNWDADEKFIMPGLEDRVLEKRWREAQAANKKR